jgi:hypothetical protein
MIHGAAFALTDISTITVERGHQYLSVSNKFLLDAKSERIIRYFGTAQEVSVPSSIVELSLGCFFAAGVFQQ